MSTWLTTIVINSARMKLRRRPSQAQISLDETGEQQNVSLADMVSDTRPGPDEWYSKRPLAETLACVTSRLSTRFDTTFQLRASDVLSSPETADLLCVPAGPVKQRLKRDHT